MSISVTDRDLTQLQQISTRMLGVPNHVYSAVWDWNIIAKPFNMTTLCHLVAALLRGRPPPELGTKRTNKHNTEREDRKMKRSRLTTGLAAAILVSAASNLAAQLPNPGMEVDLSNTALVITDPQIDFLSPEGVTWGVVGVSVTENNTVENIGNLLNTAKEVGMQVYISPHYYYPTDHGWKFEGALETMMHAIGMFDRQGPLTLNGFENSGADWLEPYRVHINDGETVIVSPHKVYGPETNDLVLQLRKRGIDRVILAGMSANLCTEAHMRELIEQGFEVAVVTDGTAAAVIPDGDGYAAAMTNFRFIANATWTTEETVARMRSN